MGETLVQARVISMTSLTDSIVQLFLKPDVYVDYLAGQYLQIIDGDESFSYSIANAPSDEHVYELHIRHVRDKPYSQSFFSDLLSLGVANLRLPMGGCHVGVLHPDRPVLFIAGGTGFAPIKAMIEQLRAEGDLRACELFWSARTQSDLYMVDKVLAWQEQDSHFNFFSKRSEHDEIALVDMVLQRHGNDILNWQIVISGPFDMSFSIRDSLIEVGVSSTNLFSDAFS